MPAQLLQMSEKRKERRPRRDHDKWIRRLAMQIAVQLPDNEEDALAILECAKRLVREV